MIAHFTIIKPKSERVGFVDNTNALKKKKKTVDPFSEDIKAVHSLD